MGFCLYLCDINLWETKNVSNIICIINNKWADQSVCCSNILVIGTFYFVEISYYLVGLFELIQIYNEIREILQFMWNMLLCFSIQLANTSLFLYCPWLRFHHLCYEKKVDQDSTNVNKTNNYPSL